MLESWRACFLGVTGSCMGLVAVAMILVLIYRKNRVIKTSAPGLLLAILVAIVLQYAQLMLELLPPTRMLCIIRPWFQHLGFSLAAACLVWKSWRLMLLSNGVIRSPVVKEVTLYKRTGTVLLVVAAYQLIWSVADTPHVAREGMTSYCKTQLWSYVIQSAELLFLLWGMFTSMRTQCASESAETRLTALVLWNETVWASAGIMLLWNWERYPDREIRGVGTFIIIHIRMAVLLMLLFVTKFYKIFHKSREVHTSVMDVDSTRVHRLTVVINEMGDIRSVHCVPCGPMAPADDAADEETTVSEVDEDNDIEDNYTKTEVDALIDLVSQLKSQRQLYREQIRQYEELLGNHNRRYSCSTDVPCGSVVGHVHPQGYSEESLAHTCTMDNQAFITDSAEDVTEVSKPEGGSLPSKGESEEMEPFLRRNSPLHRPADSIITHTIHADDVMDSCGDVTSLSDAGVARRHGSISSLRHHSCLSECMIQRTSKQSGHLPVCPIPALPLRSPANLAPPCPHGHPRSMYACGAACISRRSLPSLYNNCHATCRLHCQTHQNFGSKYEKSKFIIYI